MDDNSGGFLGGAMLRPNRSFTFENGKLVVEGDVAAGIPGYLAGGGGDVAWPEIVISSAPNPTKSVIDSLYAYGQFGGFWSVGCRLHASGKPICAVESATPTGKPGNDTSPCFSFGTYRLIEASWFEQCGSVHDGGLEGFGGPSGSIWRLCQNNQMDMFCRDRFRMEITKTGLTLYVNGKLYFQDTNWPTGYQLPDSFVNGPVYAYMADWEDTPSQPAYRFHWGHLAVNPHNPDGSLMAPTAAPSYCPGMPQYTCDMNSMPTPMPTSMAVSTSTPSGPAIPLVMAASAAVGSSRIVPPRK